MNSGTGDCAAISRQISVGLSLVAYIFYITMDDFRKEKIWDQHVLKVFASFNLFAAPQLILPKRKNLAGL